MVRRFRQARRNADFAAAAPVRRNAARSASPPLHDLSLVPPYPIAAAARSAIGAASQTDGEVLTPAPAPQPVPTPPVVAPTPAPAACAIRTLVPDSTPDGSPRTRTKVGVNEQVAMDAGTPVKWTASGGTFFETGAASMTWTAPTTAPEAGIDCTITATPPTGSPCSVTMKVVRPSHRVLTKTVDRIYADDRSGSGFDAIAAILPGDVSFARVQVREGRAEGVASGYYERVMGWDKRVHNPGGWSLADTATVRIEDHVGTEPPGGAAPFGPGFFLWRIPQFYRPFGDAGDGEMYSIAVHLQLMTGATGSETTDKEGEQGERTPGPRPAPPAPPPARSTGRGPQP